MFTNCRALIVTALFAFSLPALAQQMPVFSKTCPAGSKSAQEIFHTGMQIRSGKDGQKKNPLIAEEYFVLAMSKGSARAAFALGEMYRYDFADNRAKPARKTYMTSMYTFAAEKNCPEAWATLAECHEKGTGAKKDPKKAMELAKQAADANSPKGMEVYGRLLAEQEKDVDTGRQWLKRAIEAGNGDAGMPLADTYAREKDSLGVLTSLRAGAAKGSKKCLEVLTAIFLEGHYGQEKDLRHAACYRKLAEGIDDYETPRPIANLDKQCPRKKFLMPFQNR